MPHPLPLALGELTLRRIGPEDARDLYEIYSRPEVARYDFWDPWEPDDVETHIRSQYEIRVGDPGVPLVLGVVLTDVKKLIGDCQITINSIDFRQAEIGFCFNPDYGGRGYATSAVNACLGFAFLELDMHRVIASVDVRNQRSWRLMERLGMRREAHFIHASLIKNEWVDDYLYALLDEEWRHINSR